MRQLMSLGEVMTFHSKSANEISQVMTRQLERLGIEAQLTFWTDPPNADPNFRCKTVFLMRCDGMSEEEIENRKTEHSWRPDYGENFLFDPVAWNERFPPSLRCNPDTVKRMAPSKLGWEYLKVGDTLVATLYPKDLRFFLGRAMLRRSLDWQFRCERLPFLEDARKASPTPVWKVTRIK